MFLKWLTLSQNKGGILMCLAYGWRKSELQIHLSTLCSVQFCAVFVHILEIILCKQPQISASICIGPLILPEIKISLKSNQTWNYLNIQDFFFGIWNLSRQCFNQTRQSIAQLQVNNSDHTLITTLSLMRTFDDRIALWRTHSDEHILYEHEDSWSDRQTQICISRASVGAKNL